MNTADIIVILAVAAIIAVAFLILRHNRKSGKMPCGCSSFSCSGSCSGCSQLSSCKNGKSKSPKA